MLFFARNNACKLHKSYPQLHVTSLNWQPAHLRSVCDVEVNNQQNVDLQINGHAPLRTPFGSRDIFIYLRLVCVCLRYSRKWAQFECTSFKMSSAAPQLRNLLRRKIGRDIAIGLSLSVVTGSLWWFSVVRPRRVKYENFYKNYDANAVAQATKASFEKDWHPH